MKNKTSTSYDELLKTYYGHANRTGHPISMKADELVASSYGKPTLRIKRSARRDTPVALSLSFDDGELLSQRAEQAPLAEYVVQKSQRGDEFEEYVVERATPVDVSFGVLPEAGGSVDEEYQVDLLQPLESANRFGTKDAAAKSRPEPGNMPQDESSQAEPTDDDFYADMQSILNGDKVFDPLSKKIVEKNKRVSPQSVPAKEDNKPPLPEAPNSQAIFDRIAQSMQYANAYDLGTVELENRFSDFDKIADLQQKAGKARVSKNTPAPSGEAVPAIQVNSEDFIQDLDEIQKQHLAKNEEAEMSASAFSKADETEKSPTVIAEIEALNLAETARAAAYALKAKHPNVIFTSGRRTKQEQAAAMAGNVVRDRQWIKKTYFQSKVSDECQKWVDDHPEALTKQALETGILEVLDRYSESQLSVLTKHIAGLAFDIQPIAGEDGIKNTIRGLQGLDKFLEREGDLVIWHAQFK
jgi:hypothetical protein